MCAWLASAMFVTFAAIIFLVARASFMRWFISIPGVHFIWVLFAICRTPVARDKFFIMWHLTFRATFLVLGAPERRNAIPMHRSPSLVGFFPVRRASPGTEMMLFSLHGALPMQVVYNIPTGAFFMVNETSASSRCRWNLWPHPSKISIMRREMSILRRERDFPEKKKS